MTQGLCQQWHLQEAAPAPGHLPGPEVQDTGQIDALRVEDEGRTVAVEPGCWLGKPALPVWDLV